VSSGVSCLWEEGGSGSRWTYYHATWELLEDILFAIWFVSYVFLSWFFYSSLLQLFDNFKLTVQLFDAFEV